MVENNVTDFKDCEEFANLTQTPEDNWFYADESIGSGDFWTEGWVKE